VSSKAQPEQITQALKLLDQSIRLAVSAGFKRAGIEESYASSEVLCFLHETPGISGAKLARLCMVTPQTMNQMLSRLERQGFVYRQEDPEHGRILNCYLTPAGTAYGARCEAVLNSVLNGMQRGISAADRHLFQSLITRFTSNVMLLNDEPEQPPAAKGRKAAF
jgi:DNA-binding MarR family transcriptional regulator